jgi:hypothetical protein
VYAVKINGVKHMLGVTQNAPPKLRARVRRQVAGDPVSRAMLIDPRKARGAGKTRRVIRGSEYVCGNDVCHFRIDHPPAFDYPGGCGDVIVQLVNGYNDGNSFWFSQFNTWSHWCALGTTIGYAPRLFTSQTNTVNAWPLGTNSSINPYYYNYYGHGPYSGWHVQAQATWGACAGGCDYWLAWVDHWMHYDGTEDIYLHAAGRTV